MEGRQHSGRYLTWRPGGLDDVPLVHAEVVKSRVKMGESRWIGTLANAPAPRAFQAGVEVGPEDRVVQRNVPIQTRLSQFFKRIGEHVAIHDHGVATLGELH